MTFIVDGQDWKFDGLSGDMIIAEIERALEFVAASNTKNERVLIGDDFQSRKMMGDLALWELFGPDAPIESSGEVLQELAAWLGTNPLYCVEDDWPDELDAVIKIGNELPVQNDDVAWAHHHNRAKRATACFSLKRHGCISTQTSDGAANVHFVQSEKHRTAFWRDSIILAGDTAATLSQYCERAYPNLYFHGEVIMAVTELDGGYDASRELVRETLATLDDHAGWIFRRPPPTLSFDELYDTTSDERPTNRVIIERFGGVGLNVAPEKPNVGLDRNCREAREVNVEGKNLYCHWHVKLQRHRNRIHIHAPIPEVAYRTVIAIIHEHLPLP